MGYIGEASAIIARESCLGFLLGTSHRFYRTASRVSLGVGAQEARCR